MRICCLTREEEEEEGKEDIEDKEDMELHWEEEKAEENKTMMEE